MKFKEAKICKEKFVAEVTEEYIDKVGDFGRYQKLYIVIIQLVTWHYCGNFMFLSYAGLPTVFSCGAFDSNQTASSEDSERVCDLMQRCPENLTVRTPQDFRTITDEWPNEVLSYCHDGLSSRFLSPPKALITFVVLAAGLSVIPAGVSSDLFGRRRMLLWSALAATCLGCCTAFMQSITAVTAVYISAVVTSSFAALPALSLCSEYTSKKYRLIMNLCTTWFTAFLVAALVGWLTRDWRRYMVVFNTLGLPLAVSLWFFDESPRWLLINKRFAEAADVLNHISKVNRAGASISSGELEKRLTEFDSVLHDRDTNADVDHEDKCHSVKEVLSDLVQIFTNGNLRPVSLLLLFYQFGSAGLSVTFNFNLEHSAYSPYFTIALLGLLRLWAPFVLALLELKLTSFKRRSFFLLGSFLVAIPMTLAVACSLAQFAATTEELKTTFNRIFTVVHTVSIATNFGFLWFVFTQTSIEVFPTVIRSAAMATLHLSTTAGATCGPLLLRLQKVWMPFPHVILAVWIWVVFGLGMVYYPETKGKNLPDTFDDLHFVFNHDPVTQDSEPSDEVQEKSEELGRDPGPIEKPQPPPSE